MEVKTKPRTKYPYPGFQKGLDNLIVKDLPKVRVMIQKILGINNPVSFRAYRKGEIEPSYSKAQQIEALFRQFGVTDPWGKS